MTVKEMNARIDTIPQWACIRAERLISEGWGARSIEIETGLTRKQVNAVFQKVQPV